MKKQFLKKPLAFIIVIMLFSLLPKFIEAQNGNGPKCNNGNCPPRYFCMNGYCKKYVFRIRDSSSVTGTVNISHANSTATSFKPMQAESISEKIYDATGRLVYNPANRSSY